MRSLLMAISLTTCVLSGGCNGSTSSDQSKNTLSTTKTAINWSFAGQLPAPEGYSESIGISAAFSGFIGDYLVVAGGANFPAGHPFFDGGKKAFYADIFVYDVSTSPVTLVAKGQLPYRVANGVAIKQDDALYLIGGSNEKGFLNCVTKLTLRGTQPQVELLGELPFGWELGGAAIYQQDLYLFAGEVDGKATNRVFQIALKDNFTLTELEPVPGPERVQFPFAAKNSRFFVFGGIDPNCENKQCIRYDSVAFDFNTKQWQSLADITHKGEHFSVSGGAAISLSGQQILLLGGVDSNVFNYAVTSMNALSGDELHKFKTDYFNLSVQEINFSRQQLIFDTQTLSWASLDTAVPFPGGAGPLSLARSGNSVFWIGGEVKPVIRTPNIYRGQISSD